MKSKLYFILTALIVNYSLLLGCAKNGSNGIAGTSCTVITTPGGALISCQDGSTAPIFNGINGNDGAAGPIGPAGPQGEPGLPGISCTALTIGNYLNIICGTQVTQIPIATLIETIPLCPNTSGGVFKEYLIRIGTDLYGVYAAGSNIGLSKLWNGNWVTTDGRNCHFTIAGNNVL